jgi:hypothetical protein
MLSASGRPGLPSLGIAIAAYAIGTAFAAAVTTHAAWRVGTVVLQQLAPAAVDAPPSGAGASEAPAKRATLMASAIGPQSIRREGAMTPLADRASDRWDGRWGGPFGRSQPRVWGSAPSQFGTSSRNPYRNSDDDRPYGWDDDERPVGAYRTVCVRLCDGYYFPVSFAVAGDRLERDREVCASRCGAQGRLFVHRNPGGSADDMQDLAGRPYRQLRTAFLYRTEYVANCACQPQPWEQAAQDRHRLYALAAAVRKGDKEAAKELQVLQSKARDDAKLAARPGPPSMASPSEGARGDPAATARAAEIARREDGTFMGLGVDGTSKANPDATSERAPLMSRSDRDWARRTFEFGGRY